MGRPPIREVRLTACRGRVSGYQRCGRGRICSSRCYVSWESELLPQRLKEIGLRNREVFREQKDTLDLGRPSSSVILIVHGGVDGTRTRDLLRDRQAF